MTDAPRILVLLRILYKQGFLTHRKLGKLEHLMTDATTAMADLGAAQAAILTAVTDAANAIKDLAAKLSGSSSINPGDVESAAASLNSIAAGLEAVVVAAGEPVTEPAPTPAPVVAPASTADPIPPVLSVGQPATSTSAGTEGATA